MLAEREPGLVLALSAVCSHLGHRIDRAIRALRAQDRRPERRRELGERIARAEPPDGGWDDLRDLIAQQAGAAGPFEEPLQWRLRERIALVAAADIRVRADEPALLDSVGPRRRERCHRRCACRSARESVQCRQAVRVPRTDWARCRRQTACAGNCCGARRWPAHDGNGE